MSESIIGNCVFCGGENKKVIKLDNHEEQLFCLDCAASVLECVTCHNLNVVDAMKYVAGEGFACESCEVHVHKCRYCGKTTRRGIEMHDGKYTCHSCAQRHGVVKCPTCNKYHDMRVTQEQIMQYPDALSFTTCTACMPRLIEGLTPKEIAVCSFCGDRTSSFHKYKNGKIACHECKPHVKKCPDCGELKVGGMHTVASGKKLCTQCIETKYKWCDVCEKFHLRADMFNDSICNECHEHSFICDRCRRRHRNEAKTVVDGHELCSNCVEATTCTCQLCGNRRAGVWERSSHRGAILCYTCSDGAHIGTIHSYGHKPAGEFKPSFDPNGLYIGIENEITLRDFSTIKSLLTAGAINAEIPESVMYLKRDSSVHNGFECVTHPMTFEWAEAFDWGKYFEIAKPSDNNSSCGMHVHMSKAAFGQSQIFKFLNFIYDNEKFVTFVAGRESNSYCAKMDKGSFISKAQTKRGSDRGQVNMIPAHTIEIRIFRGAHNEATFRKNYQFCVALFEFTKKRKLMDVNVPMFKQWVEENKDRFAQLNDYIKDYRHSN